jgi:transcription antitermination factor NusA-like protein
VEEKTLERLKLMLGVKIEKVEEQEDGLIIYVPKGQVAKAIGSGGSVIKSAELVLKRKLQVKEL